MKEIKITRLTTIRVEKVSNQIGFGELLFVCEKKYMGRGKKFPPITLTAASEEDAAKRYYDTIKVK